VQNDFVDDSSNIFGHFQIRIVVETNTTVGSVVPSEVPQAVRRRFHNIFEPH
jgi:hypothetical protein